MPNEPMARIPMMTSQTMERLARTAISIVLLSLIYAGCQSPHDEATKSNPQAVSREQSPHGVIVNAGQVTKARLAEWQTTGAYVALLLTTESNHKQEQQAAESVRAAGLVLDYFVEVGRCPELAEAHPEWMASLQVHDEWRTRFPDVPNPTDGQVVKNFPWVPILNQECFDAQIVRVKELLAGMPAPRRIWLNDLQGAPSACGCGHPLCRWTADYGPIKTATSLDHHAAAQFINRIREMFGEVEIIPIFVGECEAEDKDTVCCGVACFDGRCWKDFTKQLDSVAVVTDKIAVACFYKLFERDLDRYGSEAGWVAFTLKSFSEMPRLRNGIGVTPDRLIGVLQGWNVSESQIEAQIQQARKATAAEWIVSLTPINQSWQPVVFDLPDKQINNPTTADDNGNDDNR